jgi:NAD(P)-dependent dehydrogenase (short-subunit alcohol dehydrogenase family)
VLFLASDEARYITGVTLPVDAGSLAKWPAAVDPVDISNAVLFLDPAEARYVTGTELKIDAGYTIK